MKKIPLGHRPTVIQRINGLPMTWSNDDPTDLNHEPPTFTPITEYEREQRSQRNEMPDEEFNIHNDIADRNWETIRM